MDPAKHVSKNKETGMYCVYNKKGEKVKEFKDKKDAVAYATKNHDDLMKEMVDPMDLRGRPKKKDPHPNSPYGLKHPLHPSNIAKRKERQKKAATIKRSESVEEAINHDDAHRDAQQHSNGSMSVKKIPSMIKKPGDKHLHLHMKSYHKEKDGQGFAKKHGYKVSNYVKTPSGTRMDIHKEEVSEAKVYSKPAKLPRAVAMNPKVRAAQRAHAKGDWDGNVDKEGNAIVHINSKPYTVTKQESVNTADRKPETYRKPDGKMGTRMVPTHKDVVKEGTEVGETKWAAVNMFAGGDKFGGRGIQITGLNGQGKSNMELVRQKGAYMQMPAKELPKLIKLLQQALKMTRDTKKEEVELDEAMSPAQKAAHDKAIAAFKARGGKVTKLPPGKAAGYHGKDDPGSGVHGMLNKPDTGKFGTKKKVKSMTNSVNEDPAHYAAIARNNAAQQAKRDAADPEGARKRKAAKAAIAKKKPVKPADIGRHSSQFVGIRSQKESTEVKTFFDIRKEATLEAMGESMLGHSGAEKANGGKSLDPKHNSAASHIDYHHRQTGGHNKSGGDQDRHRYQVAKKLGYNV